MMRLMGGPSCLYECLANRYLMRATARDAGSLTNGRARRTASAGGAGRRIAASFHSIAASHTDGTQTCVRTDASAVDCAGDDSCTQSTASTRAADRTGSWRSCRMNLVTDCGISVWHCKTGAQAAF